MKVRAFRRREVKKLLAEKRHTLGRNSVRLIKAALSTVLSQAVEEEILAVNPGLGRFRESRHVGSPRQADVKPMSHEQLARFKQTVTDLQADNVMNARLAMQFLVMAGTGLRPSEALALQPSDFDPCAKTLRVERAVDLDGQIKSTKTEEMRTVDLSNKLVERLKEYIAWRDAEAVANGKDQATWLSADTDSHPPDISHIRKVFARVLKKAELPHFKLYDLRHTYASLLLSAGVPLLYVAKQLGHAKPTTTLRHYAKWIPSEDRRYADLLDRESGKSWHQNLAPNAENEGKAERPKSEVVEKSGGKFGGPCRGRTYGPLIKSQLLYQLS
jgi:integrase